jgi:hypothetical protein
MGWDQADVAENVGRWRVAASWFDSPSDKISSFFPLLFQHSELLALGVEKISMHCFKVVSFLRLFLSWCVAGRQNPLQFELKQVRKCYPRIGQFHFSIFKYITTQGQT